MSVPNFRLPKSYGNADHNVCCGLLLVKNLAEVAMESFALGVHDGEEVAWRTSSRSFVCLCRAFKIRRSPLTCRSTEFAKWRRFSGWCLTDCADPRFGLGSLSSWQRRLGSSARSKLRIRTFRPSGRWGSERETTCASKCSTCCSVSVCVLRLFTSCIVSFWGKIWELNGRPLDTSLLFLFMSPFSPKLEELA